jgi:hypothetical protein
VVASDEQVEDAVAKAAESIGAKGTLRFLLSEWRHVVDAWQIADVEAYAKVPRLGRKNRMSAGQRERLWPVFVAVRASLAKRGLATWADINGRVAAHYAAREVKPFTHIVVDEAQDLGVSDCGSLAAISPKSQDALSFAGDQGQRIFQQRARAEGVHPSEMPFSFEPGTNWDVPGQRSRPQACLGWNCPSVIRTPADRSLSAQCISRRPRIQSDRSDCLR